jgi:hypothetical protein
MAEIMNAESLDASELCHLPDQASCG